MLDKLDPTAPRLMPFRSEFARAWNNPVNDEIFKKTRGGMYAVTGDLRAVGIPARLSCGHKHHEKLGPKIELMGVGEMHYSSIVSTLEEIFQGDVEECEIMRLDATADVKGVSVEELARAYVCRSKQTNQDIGEAEFFRRLARMKAQTVYHGNKPRQLRIYDKTQQRIKVLLPAIHRSERNSGRPLSTFFQIWGYEPTEKRTRVERQMGAREPAERWGIHLVGQIPELMKRDPFEQMRFADDLRQTVPLEELKVQTQLLINYIRQDANARTLPQVKASIRAAYGENDDSFKKFWNRHESYFVNSGVGIPTREELTAEFHRTLALQLAA